MPIKSVVNSAMNTVVNSVAVMHDKWMVVNCNDVDIDIRFLMRVVMVRGLSKYIEWDKDILNEIKKN